MTNIIEKGHGVKAWDQTYNVKGQKGGSESFFDLFSLSWYLAKHVSTFAYRISRCLLSRDGTRIDRPGEDLFWGQREEVNEARHVAMYLVRQLNGRSLKGIAEVSSLESYGSIGGACGVIKSRIRFKGTPPRHIEGGTEMVSSPSIQKKS